MVVVVVVVCVGYNNSITCFMKSCTDLESFCLCVGGHRCSSISSSKCSTGSSRSVKCTQNYSNKCVHLCLPSFAAIKSGYKGKKPQHAKANSSQ